MGSKLILAAVLAAVPAGAEVRLDSARWELSRVIKPAPGKMPKLPAKAKPEQIQALPVVPGRKLDGRVQARVVVSNKGAAEQAVLLRYAVSARVAPNNGGHEAEWALPVLVAEKRVPKIAADKTAEVVLDATEMINLTLIKFERVGWWPKELKLKVQVEPRRGQTSPLNTFESVLPLMR